MVASVCRRLVPAGVGESGFGRIHRPRRLFKEFTFAKAISPAEIQADHAADIICARHEDRRQALMMTVLHGGKKMLGVGGHDGGPIWRSVGNPRARLDRSHYRHAEVVTLSRRDLWETGG